MRIEAIFPFKSLLNAKSYTLKSKYSPITHNLNKFKLTCDTKVVFFLLYNFELKTI